VTLSAILLAGCSNGLLGDNSRENTASGARLSIDYDLDTDVVGFHFEVERVACSGDDTDFERFFYEENVALDDMLFPGSIDFLEGAPFDASSMHQGADFFVALEPGCYVVTAAPASSISEEDWSPSVDCSTAESGVLEVVGGYTTETVLISQCRGELVGALDTLVLLNKPPIVIPDIENKFNSQCEAVEICATAWDPNDDPIEITFENLSDAEFFSIDLGPLTLVDYEDGHRVWEQCATIVTDVIADYNVEIRAYDVAYDEHGAEIRIEDLIDMESHGFIQVPIHTGWNVSDACVEEDGDIRYPTATTSDECGHDDCSKDCDDSCDHDYDGDCDSDCHDECDPDVCIVISDEDFLCSGDYAAPSDLSDLVCDGSDLLEDVLYPTCED
jgi:hypothetical protein